MKVGVVGVQSLVERTLPRIAKRQPCSEVDPVTGVDLDAGGCVEVATQAVRQNGNRLRMD
jgi:hypothetical protein